MCRSTEIGIGPADTTKLPQDTETELSHRLTRQIKRTRAALWIEESLRRFWPVVSLLAVIWAALSFGLLSVIPPFTVKAVLFFSGLAALALFALGVRRFVVPTEDAATQRLDGAVPGRPIAALRDRQAVGKEDPVSQALWTKRLARMTALAANVRAARPNYGIRKKPPGRSA